MASKAIGYNANPRLRAAGIKILLTKEQLKQYIKCSENPIYFIENFVKIVSIDEGLTDFKLWKFQKNIIKTCYENNRIVLNCARQVGKTSTIAIGYLMWYMMFNPDKSIAILAQKQQTAIEILSRIKNAYMNLPQWIQHGIVEWNKSSVELENGSKIMSSSTSSDAVRGFSFSIIYLDEFGYVPNNIADDFLTSVYPTISSGKSSKIIISSTPHGLNHFYRIVESARKQNDPKNNWKLLEYDWTAVPTRDKAWEADQLRTLGEQKFQQEHQIEFLGSAGTLISATALRNLTYKDPIKQLEDYKLKIYTAPVPGHQYILVADSGYGKELDYSAFSIFDVTKAPYEIVCTYRSNDIASQQYPSVISTAGMYYNRAYVLAENNDIGSLVLKILIDDLEYENVFYTDTEKNFTSLSLIASDTAGIRTTPKVKRQATSALKTIVETQQVIINDYVSVSELSTFVIKKNKTYAADDGCNDDTTMCLALFAWLTTQDIFKSLIDQDLRKNLFDKYQKELEEDMPPLAVHVQATPQPKSIVEDGILWIIVERDQDLVDDKWSGYPGPSDTPRGW